MIKKTALYDVHVESGGKMVDFSGWSLPIHYGSQMREHHAVRQKAGIFDVSHMTILDCSGASAKDFLRRVLANDVASLGVDEALYSILLNDEGGVVDDLIVYRLAGCYRLVTNASTRDKVTDWLQNQNKDEITIKERKLAMLAVQGPESVALMKAWNQEIDFEALSAFNCKEIGSALIARTGYTGEDGFEVILPEDDAAELWHCLIEQGAHAAGLGARDTLRLEAGLNLYGHEMDDQTNPLTANLGWTIKWNPEDRLFIGRRAIEGDRKSVSHKLVGLILDGKGILRQGQKVQCLEGDGLITSGSYSPTMERSIGLARVPKSTDGKCDVEIRGKLEPCKIVPLPFVRRGKVLVN